MIARLTYIAGPDTMDPTNVDPCWPDNPPSEAMCKDCGEVDVEEEGDLCAACYTDMILHMND